MERRYDICNGDSDGLCAAVQWRLHRPGTATLVTGLKREIALLERVPADASAPAEVNVFDISMQRNLTALQTLLDAGVRVNYFDHHTVEAIPAHPLLDAHVDRSSDVCTSLLVDRYLGGAYRAWALVGAYGDNLPDVADRLAEASGIGPGDRTRLRLLGEAINYNAYGDDACDVRIAPARLYTILSRYADPREMLVHESIAGEIDDLRRADLERARVLAERTDSASGSVHVLPDAPWSRRVLGSYANELANAEPDRAHAVMRLQGQLGYMVSVRAPLASPHGADVLCARFGGSGRPRAAGVDALEPQAQARFFDAFAANAWTATLPARRA